MGDDLDAEVARLQSQVLEDETKAAQLAEAASIAEREAGEVQRRVDVARGMIDERAAKRRKITEDLESRRAKAAAAQLAASLKLQKATAARDAATAAAARLNPMLTDLLTPKSALPSSTAIVSPN
jgi:hypothetical protein